MAAAAGFRVDMKFTSATDLMNVNWRDEGHLRPYFSACVDGGNKQCTYVAVAGQDGSYSWDRQILYIPFSTLEQGATLHVECLHHVITPGDHPDTEASVGTTEIDLHALAKNISTLGKWHDLPSLKLKRWNGRPQGEVVIRISIRQLGPDPDTSMEDEEQYYDGPEEM